MTSLKVQSEMTEDVAPPASQEIEIRDLISQFETEKREKSGVVAAESMEILIAKLCVH